MLQLNKKSIYHEGWMWKWTNYFHGYQRRWFVLSDNKLSYYLSIKDVSDSCRGQVSLATVFFESPGDDRILVKKDGYTVYDLNADSVIDHQRWITALELSKLANASQQSANKSLGSLLSLEEKFESMEECHKHLTKHETDLFSVLGKMEATEITKLREMCEKLKIFGEDCSQMLITCLEFIQLVKNQSIYWQDDNFEECCENVISDDDDEFVDASGSLLVSERVCLVEANLTLAKSVYSGGKIETTYRTKIPFKPNQWINLWSILKNSIGRDITKLPLPVNFNEPLSVLQRLTEELEYSELLDEAAKCKNSAEQMLYVVAFSISTYSTLSNRTSKPFNPLLGETYELDCTEERGFKVICEQVSHHPPIAAVHAESTKKELHRGWEFWMDATPESKFCGNYMILKPVGLCHLKFRDTGHHYTWNKATISVNNIILGGMWIDQIGDSRFVNHSTGDKCNITFHQYNRFLRRNYRKISGNVSDKEGREKFEISGKWDRSVSCRKLGPTKMETEELLWEIKPPPPHSDRMYNFTYFTFILNQWEDGTAPTDSRRRPDQRKMEEGEWDLANKIKLDLEEKQRQRKRLKDTEDVKTISRGLPPQPYEPFWFRKERCPLTGEEIFIYKHEYWEAKEKQNWPNKADIFLSSKPYPNKNAK